MPTLYLVRHGEAEAGWSEATDPGLSKKGNLQAEEAANRLTSITTAKIITSPLLRCRQTAKPLEKLWRQNALVNEAVAEIPSPKLEGTARTQWLQNFFNSEWADIDQPLTNWRNKLIRSLARIAEDAVIFTHFVAINVAVGHATSSDRTLCFRPDNCSVTKFENDGRKLSLISHGAEANTKVN